MLRTTARRHRQTSSPETSASVDHTDEPSRIPTNRQLNRDPEGALAVYVHRGRRTPKVRPEPRGIGIAHSARSTRRRGSNSDREERPGPRLGDRQLHIACRRRQPPDGGRCAGCCATRGISCRPAPIEAVSSASISSCHRIGEQVAEHGAGGVGPGWSRPRSSRHDHCWPSCGTPWRALVGTHRVSHGGHLHHWNRPPTSTTPRDSCVSGPMEIGAPQSLRISTRPLCGPDSGQASSRRRANLRAQPLEVVQAALRRLDAPDGPGAV